MRVAAPRLASLPWEGCSERRGRCTVERDCAEHQGAPAARPQVDPDRGRPAGELGKEL